MPKLTKKQQEAANKRKSRIRILSMSTRPVYTQADIARKVRCTQQYVSRVLRAYREAMTCN